MRPAARRAPYFAPTLRQLLRYLHYAGFRLLAWQDTTAQTLGYMQERGDGRLERQLKSAAIAADRKRRPESTKRLAQRRFLSPFPILGGRRGEVTRSF